MKAIITVLVMAAAVVLIGRVLDQVQYRREVAERLRRYVGDPQC